MRCHSSLIMRADRHTLTSATALSIVNCQLVTRRDIDIDAGRVINNTIREHRADGKSSKYRYEAVVVVSAHPPQQSG
jgi:hypothetical protein